MKIQSLFLVLLLSIANISIAQHIIPLENKGHLFVKTTLNNQEGYFLVDNGSPGNWLFVAGHEALGQNAEDYNLMNPAAKSRCNANVLLAEKEYTIEFKTLLNDLEKHNQEMYPELRIFGIIGAGLLSKYVVTFDYKNEQLILEDINTPFEATKGGEVLELVYGKEGHTFFKGGTIDKYSGLVHFDTGIFEYAVFDKKLTAKLGYDNKVIPVLGLANLEWKDLPFRYRNYREVHGKKVLVEIGNQCFKSGSVKIYPLANKAVIILN